MAKEGSVAPKERVNIIYKPATGDMTEEKELPLKLLMMGDFTGKADDTPLGERKKVSIDKDTFSDVMRAQDLELKFGVENKLSDDPEAGDLPINLKVNTLKDFSPEAVAEQIPELKKLLDLRAALTALKGPLGNIPAFRKKIQGIIKGRANVGSSVMGKLIKMGYVDAAGEVTDKGKKFAAGKLKESLDEARLRGPGYNLSYHRDHYVAHIRSKDGKGWLTINMRKSIDDEDEAIKIEIYRQGIERAEAAIAEFPDDANAHYFRAFLLGRYSQSISVAKALAQGIGGRVRQSLEKALQLAPEHAEAHTAMGLYHAEIIDKVGKMVGRMTYGASADRAMEHFERALELTPEAPIAHIEYGNGLYLLFGDKRLDESNAAYERAAAIEPIDAMQKLDVEYARNSL